MKDLASTHPAQVLVLPILLGSYMKVRTMWEELGGERQRVLSAVKQMSGFGLMKCRQTVGHSRLPAPKTSLSTLGNGF